MTATERAPLLGPRPGMDSLSSSRLGSGSIHPDNNIDDPKSDDAGFITPLGRVHLTAFLLAISFAFTQTSLIYAFRIMSCDEYYASHPPYRPFDVSLWGIWLAEDQDDRCRVPEIEARTAENVALMGMMTTLCTLVNLFVTGHQISARGPRFAMFQQTFFASLRSLTQIYALTRGGATGIRIIQTTQLINILGSGGGYQLAANAFVAALCDGDGAGRVGELARVAGACTGGAGVGYVLGGLTFHFFGLLAPFQAAFCLLVSVTIFSSLFLPYIPPAHSIHQHARPEPPASLATSGVSGTPNAMNSVSDIPPTDASAKTRAAGLAPSAAPDPPRSFFAPLKTFIPRRIPNSRNALGHKRDWDLFLLALGAFFSVLATGYQGTGLQLVGTNLFGFQPGESGIMLSVTLFARTVFLTACFPRIITFGRAYLARRTDRQSSTPCTSSDSTLAASAIPAPTSETSPLVPASRSQGGSSRCGAGARDHFECSSASSTGTLIPSPNPTAGLTSAGNSGPTSLISPPIPSDTKSGTTPLVPLPPAVLPPPTSAPSPSPAPGTQFDLHFLRLSILTDAVLTALVTLASHPSHLFLAAAILPFASGTGAASKGVVLDLIPDPASRGDALAGIALVEKLAQVSTIGIFGIVFARASEAGQPTLVFLMNGIIALLGFAILLFVRMPSAGGRAAV